MRLFSLDILYEYYLFQPEAVPRLVSELGDRARFYSQPINSPECLLQINPSKSRVRGAIQIIKFTILASKITNINAYRDFSIGCKDLLIGYHWSSINVSPSSSLTWISNLTNNFNPQEVLNMTISSRSKAHKILAAIKHGSDCTTQPIQYSTTNVEGIRGDEYVKERTGGRSWKRRC